MKTHSQECIAEKLYSKTRFTVFSGQNIFCDFKERIEEQHYLTEKEAAKIIVCGNEIIENLLNHGEVGPKGITVKLHKKRNIIYTGFFVESHKTFKDFAQNYNDTTPIGIRIDANSRRWRGFGLLMCRNLLSSIAYRPGLNCDRVLLYFRL